MDESLETQRARRVISAADAQEEIKVRSLGYPDDASWDSVYEEVSNSVHADFDVVGDGTRPQQEAFEARWRSWADPAESVLEVRSAVLDEEPPRVTLGRKGMEDSGDQVTVALGRDDGPATYLVDEQSMRLSVRAAAQTLNVSGPEMSGARSAVLDGLEQSERSAGRTPADRAPVRPRDEISNTRAHEILNSAREDRRSEDRMVKNWLSGGSEDEKPVGPSVRERNAERMARRAPAQIRDEEPGAAPRVKSSRLNR